MKTASLHTSHRPETTLSDDTRVVLRYLNLHNSARAKSIVHRILDLDESCVKELLDEVYGEFCAHHTDLNAALDEHFQRATEHVRVPAKTSKTRERLIGAYFTMEYSIASAALFNPSIVPHPDQQGLDGKNVRFLMSLRATGEGHISSIVFRRGIINARGEITFDLAPKFAHSARPHPDRLYNKKVFARKLRDIGQTEKLFGELWERLPEEFTQKQLRAAILEARNRLKEPSANFRQASEELLWLAQANYTLQFSSDYHPTEIVIFPATRFEQSGMEDLRLVKFTDDDGDQRYYGTYTAYDGYRVHPMLLETKDFLRIHCSTLSGRYAHNKGMALFPRKVNGLYMMLARYDGENNYLLKSHNLYVWNTSQKLHSPSEWWELLQVGNCGSPLETGDGWLLLTHGVGPLRKYCISAILLDKEDPSKVIGRLKHPLLVPPAEERGGYVPNVVYSCGAMIHNNRVIIPYGLMDCRTSFAIVPLNELLGAMK